MALTPGNVAIAPDGSATGTGLSLVLYQSLETEFQADPAHTVGGVPGAQESLAKQARALGIPLANEINAHVDGGGGGGATGPTGADGATGATGLAGAPGVPGPIGATGATGDPGATGSPGAAGATGATGIVGPTGVAGADGATGTTGAAGRDGNDGADGRDGEPGLMGATGATGPTGAQGFSGNDGADGRDGDVGPQGTAGATGATGTQGLAGADGTDGRDGDTGPQGATGATGDMGPQGMAGTDGRDGVDGEQGLQGVPGPAPIIAAGSVLGNPISSATSLPAAPMSGTQVGQIARFGTFQLVPLVVGANDNIAINDGVTIVFLTVAGAGDANVTGFAYAGGGAAQTGASIRLIKATSAGRIVVKHEGATSTAANRIFTPRNTDWNINYTDEAVHLARDTDGAGRWRFTATRVQPGEVTNTELFSMGDGTVKLRALGAGTGPPIDGTGQQLGAITRVSGFTGATIAAGTYNNVAVAAGVKLLDVAPSGGDVIWTGLTIAGGSAGWWGVIGKFGTGGKLILKHNDAGSTIKFFTPNGNDYVLESQLDTVLVWEFNGRLQVVDRLIAPGTLAAADANGEAVAFTKRVAFSATGATGTLIDVTVWNAVAPFALRILGASLRVFTAAGTAAALRTAAAGGGTVVLPDTATPAQTFSTATAGPKPDAAGATATIALAGSLFLNVDRAVAGELTLTCVRT